MILGYIGSIMIALGYFFIVKNQGVVVRAAISTGLIVILSIGWTILLLWALDDKPRPGPSRVELEELRRKNERRVELEKLRRIDKNNN